MFLTEEMYWAIQLLMILMVVPHGKPVNNIQSRYLVRVPKHMHKIIGMYGLSEAVRALIQSRSPSSGDGLFYSQRCCSSRVLLNNYGT